MAAIKVTNPPKEVMMFNVPTAAKDNSKIPQTKQCICPVCGFENGYNKAWT